MSINTDNDGISPKYLGNGISKNFAFDFRIFLPTEIIVKKTSATGVISTLVYGTDYTVTLNANQNNNPGGSIATTTAPIVGESLVIISQVPYTQLTTLTTQGNFDPVVLNDTHDKSTVLAQQLRGQILLSVKIPDADGASLNTTLPSAVNRAGKVLKFETDGGVGVSQYDVDTVVDQVNQLATQASNSASQASSSASQASTSATNANISATSATNSANQASASATSATNSAIQAQAYANSLQWSGSVSINSSQILNSTHFGKILVCDTSAANIVLTLPEISTLTLPLVIGVKKKTSDINTVTIAPSGTNTVNGFSSKIISVTDASVSLIPDVAGNWTTLDGSLPSSGGGGGQKSIYFCGTTTTVSNIWTVTNNEITSLYDGLVIQVKFDTVTSNTIQLNLNNLGAKIVLAGGTNIYTQVYDHLNTSNLFTLVYYQNNWYVESSNMVGINNLDLDKDIKISYTSSIIPAPTLITGSSTYNKNTLTNGATYTGITSFYNPAGTIKIFEFVNSAILQHNATSFVLPTGANITTNTGDVAIFIKTSDSVNYWKCINYFNADGQSLLQSYETGSIKYFAMSTAPLGYLKANGAAVSRTTYARLFTAIGTTFGTGDGSTTFNLPDLRGEFLRGWDDGRGIDTGRVFGSWQDQSYASHRHGTAGSGGQSGGISDVGNYGNSNNYVLTGGGTSAYVTSYEGGSETRPRNIALLACIKY